MFYTYPDAEIPIPAGLALDGERGWRWFEIALSLPYYWVAVDSKSEGVTYRRHLGFNDIEHLMSLLAQEAKGMCVAHINLLSPPWMNKSDGYRMERLEAIRANEALDDLEFVLLEGHHYRYCLSYSEYEPSPTSLGTVWFSQAGS